MTLLGWLQIALYLVALVLLAKPLGLFIAYVYEGQRTFLDPVLNPVERLFYRLAGVQPEQEMTWRSYALAMLLFNGAGMLLLYLLQRVQGALPLNPQGVGAVAPDLAFNTAVSFVTNTNWQNYAGEVTMSYLTQMLGMTVQNFLSAATGMAVLITLIRALTRHATDKVGNFWVDVTRTTLYVLLPFSLLLALFLVSQGTVQSFAAYQSVPFLQPTVDSEGATISTQTLALGPAASQVAIKHIGTNGGGFFNTNTAHPFESPTPLTDFILLLAEGALAAALCYTFGRMVGETRQGWALLATMLIVLTTFTGIAYAAEAAGNPAFTTLGIDQTSSDLQPGGNMEGKEARFGIARSALFATVTTATSTGAVNAMHDSFTPLGGFVTLFMMHLGEVILGGVGSGLYGMLIFVLIAVFIAGLMVGRTPEYLGKKIEAYEMKMAALTILIMPAIVLGFTALAVVTDAGRASIYNPGPHGFSEVLYAYSSQGNNNGSAFGGLGGNTLFYNMTGALAMLFARFWLAIPTLAIAGSLAHKKKVPAGSGTLPTNSPLFIGWLLTVVLLVGALNFIPALALGPLVEQLLMGQGITF